MTAPITDVVDPPSKEIGYVTQATPNWTYFGAGAGGIGGDELEDVPALRWPNNVMVYHRMRTDAQIDSLIRSIVAPLLRLDWMINPNGARDEVVEDISTQLNLPILGEGDFVQRGRKRFNHSEHLRLTLLSPTVYGHMAFEMVGNIIDNPGSADHLAWKLSKLSPRMPQTIARWDVARDGGLIDIVQNDPTTWKGLPIPVSQLIVYPWEKEGANWTGRSMMRPLYKYWLLKDRMLRIDAIKNERFGAGIPTGTAPAGGDPANYGKMASAIRASENAGVGLPNGATIGVEGIKGTLPDTLASIQLYNEEMARSFLAMFINLGSTQTGSRALGEQFVNFFVDALAAFANWYMTITNEHLIEDIVDWNYGMDEQAPLLMWKERQEEPLGITDLSNMVRDGVLVMDVEMQKWVREKYDMPEYTGGAPLPTKPSTPIQVDPTGTGDAVTPDSNPDAPAPVQSGGKPSKGTPKDKRLKQNVKITSQEAQCGASVHSSSQTANSDKVGHRQPNAVEVAAATDFSAMQKTWQTQTTGIVEDWATVRAKQINAIVKDVTAAVKADDATALANLTAPVLGADVILKHMKVTATAAIKAAKAEAKAQGVTVPATDIADLKLEARADAVAALLARGLGQSAANNALLRYGVQANASDVADGVRDQLEGLSTSYLNDTLGGAMTQAQNSGRRLVINSARNDSTKVYSSELLDENTCEECEDEDGTDFASMDDADADYPAGGYVNCLGGPRCRGTLVAVYGEGD